ncbi:glutamine-rich protein 2-like isoform 2-T3 [Anomaloglossus baeobatrachus]|uniref:glutamine-rich protein 2-like isoform X2 n=1 Tax=Anomaloglossus baeobatrachus TaxID=238106 RepID=UPI003F4F5C1F
MRLNENPDLVVEAMTMLQDLMQVVNILKGSHRGIEKQTENMTGIVAMDAKASYSLQPTPISGPEHGTEILISDIPILATSQRTQGSSQAEDSALLVETPHVTQDSMTASRLKDNQIKVSGQQHERDLTHADPAVSTPHITGNNHTVISMDSTAVPGSPRATSQDYTMLHSRLDALERDKADRSELGLIQKNTDDLARTLPDLRKKLSSLSKEMQDLRGDRDKLEQLHRGLEPIVTQHIDQNVEETNRINQQLGSLSTTVLVFEKELKELRDRQDEEKATIEQSVADKSQQLQDQLEELHRAMDDPHHIDLKGEETNHINQQLGNLSTTVLDIEKELKELRDRQEEEKATIEQSVTDKSLQMQDQLDMLRGVLTTMASSSSTLLAMSIPQQSDSCTQVSSVTAETEMSSQGPLQTQAPLTTSTSKEHLTCPACTIDIGNKVSNLVNQYEHLQKLVTDYTSREVASKNLQQGGKATEQDTEAIGYIKNTMAKLQEECEHLNKTTKSLIHDHKQKQQLIDILYQEVGKLENKKADKDLIGLEIDVKADKCALERKVSRTRFDTSTEHLSRMIQELLGKVSAQEQDWQRLMETINVEMQNKLNRIEIEPLKNILEERWKDLSRQLKEHPPQYEADEAAGIRKQLIQRFNCISCDRTVDMMVPRPVMITIPRIPGLPAHYSSRPYSAFELNQVRQQSNRLQSGLYQARKEASQLEMSINQLRSIHAHMCKEIARVRLHFGDSDKAPVKTISHHQQTRCVTLGKLLKKSRPNYNPDHLPELGSLGYMPSSRSCGGSHTLTFSRKRFTKVPSNTTGSGQKEDTTGVFLKNEVFVLGQDGRFYRGKKANHLRTTKPKDSKIEPSSHQKVSGYNVQGKENPSEYSTVTSLEIPHGKKATTLLHMLSEELK